MPPDHMERYHKHGFDPKKDKCRYLPKGEMVREDCPDSDRGTIGFHIPVLRFEDAEKLVASDSSPQFRRGWNESVKRNNGTNGKEIIQKFKAVLLDLKDRFGFEPNLDVLIPVKFKIVEDENGMYIPQGLSELDHLYTKTSKIAISTAFTPWNGYTYGHDNLDQYIDDCIRHEIGHCCTTKLALVKFLVAKKEYQDETGLSEKQYIGKITSNYGASANVFEQIAELFSRATSPDYKIGSIPEKFESFVFDILFVEGGRHGTVV